MDILYCLFHQVDTSNANIRLGEHVLELNEQRGEGVSLGLGQVTWDIWEHDRADWGCSHHPDVFAGQDHSLGMAQKSACG